MVADALSIGCEPQENRPGQNLKSPDILKAEMKVFALEIAELAIHSEKSVDSKLELIARRINTIVDMIEIRK